MSGNYISIECKQKTLCTKMSLRKTLASKPLSPKVEVCKLFTTTASAITVSLPGQKVQVDYSEDLPHEFNTHFTEYQDKMRPVIQEFAYKHYGIQEKKTSLQQLRTELNGLQQQQELGNTAEIDTQIAQIQTEIKKSEMTLASAIDHSKGLTEEYLRKDKLYKWVNTQIKETLHAIKPIDEKVLDTSLLAVLIDCIGDDILDKLQNEHLNKAFSFIVQNYGIINCVDFPAFLAQAKGIQITDEEVESGKDQCSIRDGETSQAYTTRIKNKLFQEKLISKVPPHAGEEDHAYYKKVLEGHITTGAEEFTYSDSEYALIKFIFTLFQNFKRDVADIITDIPHSEATIKAGVVSDFAQMWQEVSTSFKFGGLISKYPTAFVLDKMTLDVIPHPKLPKDHQLYKEYEKLQRENHEVAPSLGAPMMQNIVQYLLSLTDMVNKTDYGSFSKIQRSMSFMRKVENVRGYINDLATLMREVKERDSLNRIFIDMDNNSATLKGIQKYL